MERTSSHHPIFIIAAIAVVILMVVYVLFSLLLTTQQQPVQQETKTSGTQAVNTETSFDPLVTTVPKELRGTPPKPLATDPVRGSQQPKVLLVEFGDFACDVCQDMMPVIDQLLEAFPHALQHVWKDFPLPTVHPNAEVAAQAARCAEEQDAFWQYHDALLEQQARFPFAPWEELAKELGLDETKFSECLSSGKTRTLVVQGYFIAKTLGLEGTPTYYINNQRVDGSRSFEELKAIVEEELQEATSP